ncbi:hypothetical protein EHQ19_00090 [Leptospira montravelensis]|uniref:hypothetical protein n=1 Tax=Leptospira montravelensis TaxID=2484961 RepID=UPI0011052E47|nr:hypothetical protein [Leptospira montravelensis]TGK87178.1 hypothetical protein EHQ19_00090 [Leptospira montravelensis]
MSISFAPLKNISYVKSVTETKINGRLKIFYIRVILHDKTIKTPKIIFGKLENLKGKSRWMKKFENLMAHIEYNDKRIIHNLPKFEYIGKDCEISGNLDQIDLFDIKSIEDIKNKIVIPGLKIYRKS